MAGWVLAGKLICSCGCGQLRIECTKESLWEVETFRCFAGAALDTARADLAKQHEKDPAALYGVHHYIASGPYPVDPDSPESADPDSF